jgi:hypothetical protein
LSDFASAKGGTAVLAPFCPEEPVDLITSMDFAQLWHCCHFPDLAQNPYMNFLKKLLPDIDLSSYARLAVAVEHSWLA